MLFKNIGSIILMNSSPDSPFTSTVVSSLASFDFELQKTGYAIDLYEDGSYLSVRYCKGKREGNGFLIKDNIVLKLIQFENGSPVNSLPIETVNDLVSVDTGERFEGLTYNGIPCGVGKYYDEDNHLEYSGLMISWKREGFGTSYFNNGMTEYEGHWCYDRFHGEGSLYDRKGNVASKGVWLKGQLVSFSEKVKVRFVHEFTQVSPFIKNLIIKNCNRSGFRMLDVSSCHLLEVLRVRELSCNNITQFRAVGLQHLKKIIFGWASLGGIACGDDNEEDDKNYVCHCDSIDEDGYSIHGAEEDSTSYDDDDFASFDDEDDDFAFFDDEELVSSESNKTNFVLKGSEEEEYDRNDWHNDYKLDSTKSVIVGDCPLLEVFLMETNACLHFSVLKLWSNRFS